MLLQRLAGHEGDVGAHDDSWRGPDPDPNKPAVRNKKKEHSRFARKGEHKPRGTPHLVILFFSFC